MLNSSLNRFSVVEALNVRESAQWMPYCNNGNIYYSNALQNNNIDVTEFSKVLIVVGSVSTDGGSSRSTIVFSNDPEMVFGDVWNAGTDGTSGDLSNKILRVGSGVHLISIPKFVNSKTYFSWNVLGQWVQNFVFM